MTDTPRTLSAILSLFADNSIGAISPQDLRDFVVSVATPISSFYSDVLVLNDSGLTMGGDTDLYRSAASQLETTSNLVLAGGDLSFDGRTLFKHDGSTLRTNSLFWADQGFLASNATGAYLYGFQDAESFFRFKIVAPTGEIQWGTGAAAGDTNLYRLSADLLATDDAFYSATGVFAGPNGGSTNQISLTANGVREFYGGETQPRVHLSRDNGTSGGGGLAFGPGGSTAPDTNLYRSAANQLQTDDHFVHNGGYIYSVRGDPADVALYAAASGDTVERFSVLSNGKLDWGSGSAARDTNLYRSAANVLKTDDAFHVGSAITLDLFGNIVGGYVAAQDGGIESYTLTAGTAAIATFVDGDTQARLVAAGDGKLSWGSGSAAQDTNLYRSAVDTLKTDDAFISTGFLGVFGGSPPQIILSADSAGGGTDRMRLAAHAGEQYVQSDDRMNFAPINSGSARFSIAASGDMVYFGSAYDTNLYRVAANQLGTDDHFSVNGDRTIYQVAATSSNPSFRSFVSGDSVERFSIEATGLMEWGTGSASRDTNLYRASANALATDDAFSAVGNIGANMGAAETVNIGSVGPGGKAGVLLGYPTAGNVSLYHDSSGVLKTGDNLIVAGHSAFGNDAAIDPGPISGGLNYAAQSTVFTVADDWTVADPGDGLLLSGVYAYAEFSRDTAFGTGEGDPSMIAVIGKTTWAAGAGGTGSDFDPGVMHGGWFGVEAESTDIPISFAVGVEGTVYVASGATTKFGTTGAKATGVYLGTTGDPGDFVALDAHLYSQRTGANYDATMALLFWHPSSTGTPANLYGLRISAMTAASTANYNILSEGTTTKNKFQGRVFEGTPNSAPTDADIDNGQITAYLDQSGNKIKWRARYSDGTLKTGEVALT